MSIIKKDFNMNSLFNSNSFLLKSKKGFQSYIIGLFLASFLATLLLILVLGTIYIEDNPICENVVYSIKNQCYGNGKYGFQVNNDGVSSIEFLLNEVKIKENTVGASESLKFEYRSLDEKLEILPVLYIRENEFRCVGKKQVLTQKRLLRC